ncbi:MAG: M28 family peptidase [Candidatus Kapabacteria bacterium]|nr:M28 family peptidase [Candidatus Kapabacteria bacterium]
MRSHSINTSTLKVFFLQTLFLNIFCLVFNQTILLSQSKQIWSDIIGTAYLNNVSYSILERLCDEAGGRLIGSEQNKKAMTILSEELRKIELEPYREGFQFPGWHRGIDEVTMLNPIERSLRAVALAYVDYTPEFTADMIDGQFGFDSDYSVNEALGKIVLVNQEKPIGKDSPLRYESLGLAAKRGAKAVLFINDKLGGLVIDGVTSFLGIPAPIPAYSVTLEEGKWLKRLLERNQKVTLKIKTESRCKSIDSSENTIVTLAGKTKKKIVIGAHFDSWDLGQGAVDNGHGTAILCDVARILNKLSKINYYTLEFVWFNGEEFGLWGSRKYYEKHKNENIELMINMDMTGSVTGFNAMGNDELLPYLKDICEKLKGFNMKDGINNSPWINSDQQYFMLGGIPTITPNGTLDRDMTWHYHDFGDTFDKVNIRYLSDAAAIVSVLVYELANNENLNLHLKNREEVKKKMIEAGLEKRLRKQGQWEFGD